MTGMTESNAIATDKIVCAVVIYGTKLTDCEVYQTFIEENLGNIDFLLVFDNTSTSLYEDINGVRGEYKYFWNPSNPGLSLNYNKAARFASENGCQWLLLLDQDTSFPKGAYCSYLKGISDYPDIKMFVPIHKISGADKFLSPVNAVKPSSGNVELGVFSLNDFDVINSGMLVNVDEFIKVGGYKENVSLDFSDFQFVERFKVLHNRAVALNVTCLQNFSNEEKNVKKLLGRFDSYCRNVLNFEYHNSKTRAKIAYLVVKHTAMLSVRCRSVKPVFILFDNIFKKLRR